MPNNKRCRARRSGVAIIDVLLALVLSGILVGLSVVNATSTREQGYVLEMKADLRNYLLAQETHRSRTGTYAANPDALSPSVLSRNVEWISALRDETAWSLAVRHERTPTVCGISQGTGRQSDHRAICSGPYPIEFWASDTDVAGGDTIYFSASDAVGRLESVAGLSPAPFSIVSRAYASELPRLEIMSAAWRFGDGTQTTGPVGTHAQIGHVFPASDEVRTYQVDLTLVTPQGLEFSGSRTVRIRPPADHEPPPDDGDEVDIVQGPIPEFRVLPTPLRVGQKVKVQAAGWRGPVKTPVSYDWDFGNGITADGWMADVHYGEPGDYTIELTVRYGPGEYGSARQTITVESAPPGRRQSRTPD